MTRAATTTARTTCDKLSPELDEGASSPGGLADVRRIAETGADGLDDGPCGRRGVVRTRK
jgi:hypothetical protein